MAAPLTAAQICSAHEILGVTSDVDGVIHSGFGAQLTLTQLDTLRDILDAKLAALTGAKYDRAVSLITAWDDLELDTATLENGNAGVVGGISEDPEKTRAKIRERFLILVPVYHIKDAMLAKDGGSIQQAQQRSCVRIWR